MVLTHTRAGAPMRRRTKSRASALLGHAFQRAGIKVSASRDTTHQRPPPTPPDVSDEARSSSEPQTARFSSFSRWVTRAFRWRRKADKGHPWTFGAMAVHIAGATSSTLVSIGFRDSRDMPFIFLRAKAGWPGIFLERRLSRASAENGPEGFGRSGWRGALTGRSTISLSHWSSRA